ncbi:MAG: hypothetical protein WDA09_05410 [Bacteriovoracaceae bacterium]
MSIREQMRSVINENRDKSGEPKKVDSVLQKSPVTSTVEKFNLRPRRPSEILILGEIPKIQAIQNNVESSELITARISEKSKSWIKSFSPLFVRASKRSGLGTNIQLMIQEIVWHRSELREHLHEVKDYLRQVQNSEKEYYSELGRPGEEEARLKFQKAIKYLELVLNLKRLKYEKMMVLFQKGFVDQVFIDEIHYYMNMEVYEKWSARGF